MTNLSSDTKVLEEGGPTAQTSPFSELIYATWLEAAYSVTIFSSRDTFLRHVRGERI